MLIPKSFVLYDQKSESKILKFIMTQDKKALIQPFEKLKDETV